MDTAIGFGHGENLFGTQLALLISIVGNEAKAWVGVKFKEKLLELNPRIEARRALLVATMPQAVNVEEKESKSGAKYYAIFEADQEAWLARITEFVKETAEF